MMAVIPFAVFLSLMISGSFAQKVASIVHRPIINTGKAQPTTLPQAIAESDHRKECPAGFNFIGKQCAKTLVEHPELICPKGTLLLDNNRCANYVGKESECPVGYSKHLDGACKKFLTAPFDIVCPDDYVLRGKDICVRTLPLPDKTVCPAGTTQKGDQCASTKSEAPDFVCPTGYILIGKSCQREETFDCTPARVPLPEIEEPSKLEHIRHPMLSKGKEANVYRLPASQPVVEEYVIQKTCKRIITEAARPVCPPGAAFNGKLCLIDILVNPITKQGGFKEETAAPNSLCPEGFENNGNGECIAEEEVLPNLFCPIGTLNVGDRCVIYSNPKTVCPNGFFLDGKVCIKTIFAAPLVEYTVTYSCTGKNCGAHGHSK